MSGCLSSKNAGQHLLLRYGKKADRSLLSRTGSLNLTVEETEFFFPGSLIANNCYQIEFSAAVKVLVHLPSPT